MVTPAHPVPVVSELKDGHVLQLHHNYDVMCDIISAIILVHFEILCNKRKFKYLS